MVHKLTRLRRSQVRLSITLMISLIIGCFFCVKVGIMNQRAYAWTISFGNKIGFTHFTTNYDELPELLKQSVRVHENDHLQQGTLSFWSRDGETHAYTAELAELN